MCVMKGEGFHKLNPCNQRPYHLWRIGSRIYIATHGATSKASMNLYLWMTFHVECGKAICSRQGSATCLFAMHERLGAQMGN